MLNRFLAWLNRFPATKKEAVITVISLYVVTFIGTTSFAALYHFLNISPHNTLQLQSFTQGFWTIMAMFATAAVVEELIFRIIPLIISLRRWGIGTQTLYVLIISSVLFGLSHGDIRDVLIQGILGLTLGILFIKFSDQARRVALASAIVMGVHFAYNILEYILFLLLQ